MDIMTFWKLIDKTREAAGGDAEKQSEQLTEELMQLPSEEIISFDEIFYDLKGKAYIGNLWDAAFIIMYYCSDSGFEVFREWLVGRGQEAYEKALADPETLVDVLEVGEQVFPTLLGPAMEAYEKVTGTEMPPLSGERAELQGNPTGDDRQEEIFARFPKLTAKFWEWWTRDKIYLEIQEILREILLPLGFSVTELESLGAFKFERDTLVVRWEIDYYVPDYTLYAANGAREWAYPAAILMHFFPQEYNEERKSAVRTLVREWLAIVGL